MLLICCSVFSSDQTHLNLAIDQSESLHSLTLTSLALKVKGHMTFSLKKRFGVKKPRVHRHEKTG